MITFHAVVIAWIFFRAPSAHIALSATKRMLVQILTFQATPWIAIPSTMLTPLFFGIALIGLEYMHESKIKLFELDRFPQIVRLSAYYVTVMMILIFAKMGSQQFIYFQF